MNDGVGSDEQYSPALFRANTEAIMNHYRNANNEVEFILVGTTLANPETYFDGKQPLYIDELMDLAQENEGTAAADMTRVHAELLTHKAFRDMTGNNVNHPNDFLVRWYAQFLAGMLAPSSNEAPGGSTGNDNPSGEEPPSDQEPDEEDNEPLIRQIEKEMSANLIARDSRSSYVKLTLAGGMVEVGSKDNKVFPYELTLPYDRKIGNADLTGIYFWNEEESLWEFIKGTKNETAGTLHAIVDKAGIYGSLYYDRSFSDVSSSHWASHAIKALSAAQFIEGASTTQFQPERQVNRAEFTALLVRSLGIKGSQSSPFADVAPDSWQEQVAAAGYESGIVLGNEKLEFRPDQPISRQEMAIMLFRATEWLGIHSPGEQPAIKTDYADKSSIAVWARNAVDQAFEMKLMSGFADGTFAPNLGATRAQAATVVWRLVNMMQT